MRVQLSEKSKAEFIELITKDSITCWFEGDEFVMPSGQGKTAKGIVLGKLLVWQHRQTEVDELNQELHLVLNNWNDLTNAIHARTNGTAVAEARQLYEKVDELQKKNAWLSDVAERENKRANKLQEEKVSTTTLLGKTIQEKNELQKRVDAVKTLIDEYRDPPTEDKTFRHALSIVAYELEQALKDDPTPNLNTDENGECRHFSTTMFANGKAECFQCDAVVNGQRGVIGKQSKGLHPFFKREPK